jgi:hypothetical protein
MNDAPSTGTSRRTFLRAAGIGGAAVATGLLTAESAGATGYSVTMYGGGTYSRYFYHSNPSYGYFKYRWYESWSFYSSYSKLNWIKITNLCPYNMYAAGIWSADGGPLNVNTGRFSVNGYGYRIWYLYKRFYVTAGRITQQVLYSSTQTGLNFSDTIQWRRG